MQKVNLHMGGGALWADFDQTIIKHGLPDVGDTVNHTGVGGCVQH